MQSSSGRVPAAVLACALLAAGCGPAARRVTPPPAFAAPQVVAGTGYRLDAARSELRILVYRDGALARLGHNHVLLAGDLAGELQRDGSGAPRSFAVRLPVAALRLDEPAARAAAGPDFDSVPTASDIDATRRHLLGPDQLDATRYPMLRVAGMLDGTHGAVVAHAWIMLRDARTPIDVPVTVAVAADGSVTVAGSFTVLQTALGLVPYSAALGALRVRDELAIRFRLVGEPPGASPPAAS